MTCGAGRVHNGGPAMTAGVFQLQLLSQSCLSIISLTVRRR
jgi:hypothetical protein